VEQWLRRKIQKLERMKTCPQCSTGYPDSQTDCPIHGLPLNEIRELRPGEGWKTTNPNQRFSDH
jgi:hypothetical protein